MPDRRPSSRTDHATWAPRIAQLLLRQPGHRLTAEDAVLIANQMQVRWIQAGTCFIRQDDDTHDGTILMLLYGEVSVEKAPQHQGDSLVVSIAKAGQMFGEMGVLLNAPRSASCVAYSDVALAELGRDALERLVAEHPAAAARLALGIASRLAEHLRDTSNKLASMSRLVSAMHPAIRAQALGPKSGFSPSQLADPTDRD
ncbi:MAG: cyclic nucleotide-binding domain-containing protein [Thiomonas sp.]|uniref:Crp/Fnr family transcriptional regulator n=1 Tax=Thiomonas sp. TaxID=2047785 RepID=UPI002A35941B|nr:cyclic nucleotide-binding domain-containing protein [Thiomonas sp.]MDY0331330.1 cyclic nucleotide-binding domain-containing protein [Thiomonas sp.]